MFKDIPTLSCRTIEKQVLLRRLEDLTEEFKKQNFLLGVVFVDAEKKAGDAGWMFFLGNAQMTSMFTKSNLCKLVNEHLGM